MNKKFLLALLLLSVCSINAKPKINKKEYAQLLQDCHIIASRIKGQNDFEIIRQNALRNHQQTIAGLAERFGGKGNERDSSFQRSLRDNSKQLQDNLEILRIDHERKVATLIMQAISIYLQSVGTPTAEQLARDLVKASFQNMGIL